MAAGAGQPQRPNENVLCFFFNFCAPANAGLIPAPVANPVAIPFVRAPTVCFQIETGGAEVRVDGFGEQDGWFVFHVLYLFNLGK